MFPFDYHLSFARFGRSLSSEAKDVQSFQIFLSGEWRLEFDKKYKKMVKPPTVNEILSAGRILKR